MNIIYISKDPAATDSRSGLSKYDRQYPFMTLGAAIAVATSGDSIYIEPGIYSETDITVNTPGITISGCDSNTTIVSLTGTIVISASVLLKDIAFTRSGSSVLPVLTCNVSNLSTWIDNIRLLNVSVTSSVGTAIGTLSALCHNVYAKGVVGVDWLYGSTCFDSTFIGNDPSGVLESHAVRDSQSLNKDKRAELKNCRIMNEDVKGRGINGLSESTTGNREISRWTPTQPGLVSAYPTNMDGCTISVYKYGLGIAYTDPYAIRGTFRLRASEGYGGNNMVSWVHDCDYVGGCQFLSISDSIEAVFSKVKSCDFVACGFICWGTGIFKDIEASYFVDCVFQNDGVAQLKGYQYATTGCIETSVQPNEVMGFENKNYMAVRFAGANSSRAETIPTTDYALPDMTAECWFRAYNTQTGAALLAFVDQPNPNTWEICVAPNVGAVYAVVNGVSFGAFSGSGAFDGQWHHVALVITASTTGTLFLDGVAVGTNITLSSISGSSRLIIGAHSNHSPISVNQPFKGDIADIRISKVARYSSSFVPKTHFLNDPETVSLFSFNSNKALTWSDQSLSHDAQFKVEVSKEINLPYFVCRDRALA